MITILLVDDEPEIIRVSRGYLEQAGYRVLSAGNGRQALDLVDRENPALIVLDLNLPMPAGGPPMDGLDIARAIRQKPGPTGQIPIIMLTARVEETERIIGLEMGADDYMPKPFSPRELVARIRAVLRRTTASVGIVTVPIQVGQLVIDPQRYQVTVAGETADLTPTEFTLLHGMASAPGRVFSRSQLLDMLGQDYIGLERTIDSHRIASKKMLPKKGSLNHKKCYLRNHDGCENESTQ